MDEVKTKAVAILSFIATGLVKWKETIKVQAYPYPDELRIGLNKLAAFAIERGTAYPGDIREALHLFATPINTWEPFIKELLNEDEALIENGVLTDTCYEYAMQTNDIEAELTQKKILDVMEKCKEEEKPNDYVTFRRKIIENPYMKKRDIISWSINKGNCCASEYLKDMYEEIPSSSIHNGKCFICSNCGWIVEWRNGMAFCDSHTCREVTNNFEKITPLEGNPEEYMRLKRGVLRFISRPGIHELLLEKKLKKLGIKVEMWPNYDAYDLRLTFPDYDNWAVDVKDWGNPYLLAKKAGKIPEDPQWSKAYFVIPQYRRKKCSDYREIFKKNYSGTENAGVEFEDGFMRKVKNKLIKEEVK